MEENKQQPYGEPFDAEETTPAGEQPQYYPLYDPRQSAAGGVPGQDTRGAGETPPAGEQPQYYPPYDPRPHYYNVPPEPSTPDPEGVSAARTAMILGIIAIPVLVIPGAGIILAIIAIFKALKARRLGCFSGEAIAGLVCAIVSLFITVLVFAFYLIGLSIALTSFSQP